MFEKAFRTRESQMTSVRRQRRGAFAAAAALLAFACGDGTTDDDGPTGNQFAIQIAESRVLSPVVQGSSGTAEVTLTRSGGFTGAVALAAMGFPAGITVGIDPPQLTGSASRATVTVTVAGSVAVGSYTGTVEASAMSMRSSIDIRVFVDPLPDFGLKMASETFTIPAGRTATAVVNIQHNSSFSSPMDLSLLNPPGGISATFLPPNPSYAPFSTMTISVAQNVAHGNYPVTLQATATGLSTRQLPFSITVVPAPPAGNNVTYYFCNAVDVPAFLAYQDGTGPWLAVAGMVSGGTTTFSFNIAQGRGAVLSTYPYALSKGVRLRADTRATARSRTMGGPRLSSPRRARTGTLSKSNAFVHAAAGEAYDTYVFYGSTSELVQDGRDACVQESETKTVRASVLGVAAGQYGLFSLGSATGIFDGAQPMNPFTLHDVPAGPQDLVGSRIVTPGMPPDKLILIRNVNVPDGGTLPQAIDYNGPASVVPLTALATISGAAGDQLEIFVDLITLKGSNQLWSDLAPSTATTRPWAGFGPSHRVAGDIHRIWVFATRSADPLVFRVYSRTTDPITPNQAFGFGPDLAAPTVSMAAGGSYPRFGFQGSFDAYYKKGIFIDVVGENDGGNAHYLFASNEYLGATGSTVPYNITMPDVAALTGFPTDSRLTAGVNVVTLAAVGFEGTEGLVTFGWELREAHRTLKINVP
jgi:hypothetical protein